LLFALVASGCGSTVGDACRTDQDCGGRTCRRGEDYPGGYCTQHCTLGDNHTCPSGAWCEHHHGEDVCLRRCADDVECRAGLTCKTTHGDGPFCLAPNDL